MKPLFFFLAFLLVVTGKAQTAFERAYGFSSNETAGALTAAENGSLLLGGQTGDKAFLVKVNAAGDTIWQQVLTDTVAQRISSVIVLHDGNYLFAAEAADHQSLLLVKTDTAGDVQWSERLAGDCANPHVQESADSSVFIAMQSSAGHSFFRLMKTNASGNVLWQRDYSAGPANDYLVDLDATPEGGLLLSGMSANFGPATVVYLLKADAQGDSLWSASVCDSLSMVNTVVTPDSGFIISGNLLLSSWYTDLGLVKLDAAGGMQWLRHYGGYNFDGNGTCAVVPGGYALAGTKNYFGSPTQLELFRLDTAGAVVWSATYGGSAGESAAAVIARPGNGIAILANTYSFAYGQQDFYLVSTDSTGDVPCSHALDFNITGSHCTGDLLTFDNNTVSTTTYEWLVNGQQEDTTIDHLHSFNQPGTYTISLVACGDTLTRSFDVYAPQQVGFAWSLNDLTLTVNDTNAGIQLWYWDFNDASPADTTPTAVHTYGAPGNYYVNFECVDSNGCFCQAIQLITVVSVEEMAGSTGTLTVSPNPGADVVHVHWSGTAAGMLTLRLRDVTGREVSSSTSSAGDFVLQRGDLAAGLYSVEISDGTSVIATAKLLFQ